MSDKEKQQDSQSPNQKLQTATRRSEGQGLMRFGREMTWALAMALVAIVYVIQAFKIPTGSMEKSLLVGDFLLGLKFIYGAPVLPFTPYKFPGFTDPKPGDVIIFKYPGTDSKDYIKRCVAGPGQTIEIRRKQVIIDGRTAELPPDGQYVNEGLLMYPPYIKQVEAVRQTLAVVDGDTVALKPDMAVEPESLLTRVRTVAILKGDTIDVPLNAPGYRGDQIVSIGEMVVDPRLTYFAPLRIPAAGDTIRVEGLPVREFIFLRHLIRQENPGKKLTTEIQLYVDGEFSNAREVTVFAHDPRMARTPMRRDRFGDIHWDIIDEWQRVDDILDDTREQFVGHEVKFSMRLKLDGEPVETYVVRKDNYFMMGDNRDNSLDSRYWGYLNRTNIKAKALILYFSLDSETPWALLPLKIRWNRIGKLIRGWDGTTQAVASSGR
jgi:signal peptidase I